MRKFFGTDGVRGVANTELTCELAMNIGRAAGTVLREFYHTKPTFLIGKDTRISSDMLENALSAGLCSVGANVIKLGVITTPAVAALVYKYKASAGFMISASHNPMEYNGIKIFNKDGYKLPDEIEEKIEDLLNSNQFELVDGENLGIVTYNESAVDDYIDFIKSTLGDSNIDFKNLKVALDCANGSASITAKKLFKDLSINCTIINDNPNGININKKCGSTHIEAISEFVKENKFDIGFAFDGDADRCLAVDENGNLLDGDKIVAIMAKNLKDKNLLAKNTIVVTVMSNIGLFKMAEKNNINVEITKVGDRYLLEKMNKFRYCIGGETSGHIILSDFSTTGDGQLVAVQFLKIMKESGLKASELGNIMDVYPQILINVKVNNNDKYKILDDEFISKEIKNSEDELADNGRILLRPSGTEPLVRVMVEGKNKHQIENIANRIAKIIKERIL